MNVKLHKKSHHTSCSHLLESDSDESDHKKWNKSHGTSFSSDSEKKKSSLDYSLMSSGAVPCVVLWYFFSFTTLFLNKFILSYEHGDPTVLGNIYCV